MTGAGLHLEAEPFKWEWVGALSREQVFLVESLACLVLPAVSPRGFLEGLLHSVGPEQEKGWFGCLEAQHSRPMCNAPSHQFGFY